MPACHKVRRISNHTKKCLLRLCFRNSASGPCTLLGRLNRPPTVLRFIEGMACIHRRGRLHDRCPGQIIPHFVPFIPCKEPPYAMCCHHTEQEGDGVLDEAFLRWDGGFHVQRVGSDELVRQRKLLRKLHACHQLSVNSIWLRHMRSCFAR